VDGRHRSALQIEWANHRVLPRRKGIRRSCHDRPHASRLRFSLSRPRCSRRVIESVGLLVALVLDRVREQTRSDSPCHHEADNHCTGRRFPVAKQPETGDTVDQQLDRTGGRHVE